MFFKTTYFPRELVVAYPYLTQKNRISACGKSFFPFNEAAINYVGQIVLKLRPEKHLSEHIYACAKHVLSHITRIPQINHYGNSTALHKLTCIVLWLPNQVK